MACAACRQKYQPQQKKPSAAKPSSNPPVVVTEAPVKNITPTATPTGSGPQEK